MRDIKSTFAFKWFEEVWNKGNEKLIDELISPDCIPHGITSDERGPQAFRKFYEGFRSEYNDIHIEVKNVVSDGEFEVALCDVTATHKASDTKVNFSGQCMMREANGQITEAWNNFDFLSLYRQLGAKV